MKPKSICVYCGSSPGLLPEYMEAAFTFGGLMARRGLEVVYGGGNVGLMGALADGALAEGGIVTGVIPHALAEKEIAHRGITRLATVRTMHERKTLMAELSDAFVALPGGLGTLEEIFEVCTWTQLGFQRKPCGFLNIGGFFDPLVAMLDHMAAQRFIRPEHLDMLLVDGDPCRMLDRLAAYEHTAIDKWMDRAGLEKA